LHKQRQYFEKKSKLTRHIYEHAALGQRLKIEEHGSDPYRMSGSYPSSTVHAVLDRRNGKYIGRGHPVNEMCAIIYIAYLIFIKSSTFIYYLRLLYIYIYIYNTKQLVTFTENFRGNIISSHQN
jgi:hypothetical protein